MGSVWVHAESYLHSVTGESNRGQALPGTTIQCMCKPQEAVQTQPNQTILQRNPPAQTHKIILQMVTPQSSQRTHLHRVVTNECKGEATLWRNDSACTHTNPMQPARHRDYQTRTDPAHTHRTTSAASPFHPVATAFDHALLSGQGPVAGLRRPLAAAGRDKQVQGVSEVVMACRGCQC